MWWGLQGTWPRQGLLVQRGIPSHAGRSVQPQGAGRSYSLLHWVFHLANTAQARSRQRTQGIFMEEVHASNSLSSSKLAAPAQKDLGAVNNSVWLRDFHFAGPCSPLPQGPARGRLPLLPSAAPLASPLLSAALPRCSPHVSPLTAPQPILPLLRFTFSCSPPASFSPSPCSLSAASPAPPPVPPMQHMKRVSLSAARIHWLPVQRRRQSYCAACSLGLHWPVAERCRKISASAGMANTGCWSSLHPSAAPLHLRRTSPHGSAHCSHSGQPLLRFT